jgi:hypothetical protein
MWRYDATPKRVPAVGSASGPHAPALARAAVEHWLSGRVEILAERWGSTNDRNTCVWAELAV